VTRPDFTIASINGAFAVSLSGEGPGPAYAALGLFAFDGIGGVSGSLTESRPGDHYAERTVLAAPYLARYEMTPEGLGSLRLNESDDVDAWLAVRAAAAGGAPPAVEELALVFRSLDPRTGGLRTGIARRLPDGAAFSNASLSGRYTGFGVGRGGQSPVSGFGVISYDGAGAFAENNIANVPGETVRDRRFVGGSDQGAYRVNPDGTGTVADGGVMFVITRAVRRDDGSALALEYHFMVRNLVPTNGAHFTGIVRRISD
jgi:hypothetical protein